MRKKSQKIDLWWGWVFLERTRILSGIQFTTHFIDFFVVETKRFVGSTVNVILTRQTCGQRSSKVAESKRQALGNNFSERICYMFLISKCRGERSRSVHNFGTCVWRTASQWRLPGKKRVSTQEKLDFVVALRFSKHKSRSCAQT